jgi:hypothetical protein
VAVQRHRLREHHHLERGRHVLEHERGHQVAAARVAPVERGDDPADRPQLALARVAELRERAVDVATQRALGALHRVLAHVEPEHLLLEDEPLRLRVLEVGDRDAVARTDRGGDR